MSGIKHRAIEAPDETGYVPSESPPPVGVKPKNKASKQRAAEKRAAQRGPAETPGFFMRAWMGTKLLSGILVVLGAALALAWGLQRYALTTPRFAIQKLDVTGTLRRAPDQLSKQAGVKLGDNLFAVDTEVAERRLLEDPWIASAKVERRIPATLAIHVEEREAQASASIGGSLYLVSREGEPFKQAEDGDPRDLPVISGITGDDFARDRVRQVDRIRVGMQVLRQYARVPMSKVHAPQEVNLGPDGDVVLTIGKSGIALHLGKGPWRSKLLMAWRVMGSLAAKGRLPRIVFLDNRAHPERVVVRMK
ncbi:MAG: FtsQ-type POTRA domain-containing protein [Polyangiaceae bacterium]